jgi:hypothetical protein
MADDADIVGDRMLLDDAQIHAIRYEIPAGTAGICRQCEEPSPRLIAGRCAFCRDGRNR